MNPETCDLTCQQSNSIFVGSILSLVINYVAWTYGFYRFKQPSKTENRIYTWELAASFGLFIFVSLLLIPLVAYLWISFQNGKFVSFEKISDLSHLELGWFNIIGIFLSFILIFALILSFPKRLWESIWRERAFISMKTSIFDYIFGALTWVIAYPMIVFISQSIAYVLNVLFDYRDQIDQVAVRFVNMTTAYPYLLAITLFLVVFLVPILEEVLFRGLLLTYLKQYVRRKYAIMVSAVIFSAFHFSTSQGVQNIELLVSLFALACLLGFLYERQQSLWASIGLHSSFNAISVLGILFLPQ